MNKRDQAIAEQKAKYSSGKPCRAGHHSDRYTSNGMCIECIKLKTDARRDLNKISRAKTNQALFANLRERTVMARETDLELLYQFADILQYSSSSVVNHVKEFIAGVHRHCPIPRALTRADLLTFMDYQANGSVANSNKLNLSNADQFDGEIHVIHNGHYYRASECMEVLRNQRLNVIPRKDS